jgi:hypothetical protein
MLNKQTQLGVNNAQAAANLYDYVQQRENIQLKKKTLRDLQIQNRLER